MAIYPYETEKLIDFKIASNYEAYENALKNEREKFGKTYPLIIDGKEITTDILLDSINPSIHKEILGKVYQAGIKEAEYAMEVALDRFKTWSKVAVKVRADVLFKAAAIFRRERFNLSALMTLEAGKPWVEADADVAEAIDFLEYYGRSILNLEKCDENILSIPNYERNEFKYIPLGVGAIITPWNFPLAILTGMTMAAVVSGNTVLLKPSSNTMLIAYRFLEHMTEAGLPHGVVNFIPGSGTVIGNYIVEHPKTRFISFTGSKEVGVSIYEKAAIVKPGQIWLKRVIAEMGGKDAMIIDEGVDTSFAAEEIVKAAFGFSGQKCSACSRAIIHQNVYDEVVAKIVEFTNKLSVGDPYYYKNTVGPVVDKNSYKKIKEYIEVAKVEGKIVAGGTASDKSGFFIDPTVVIDLSPTSRIMQEEIFGPVLGVTKAKDFDEAINIANNTEFGLTGAVISNDRFNLEKARNDFHVGNLYLNRKCTGAIVGYQPFGGFNMSGTDSKAGGPDYLIQHMQGKSISERF